MKKCIVNMSDVNWETNEHNNFTYQYMKLGAAAGGELLGATIYKVMPKKKIFPYHYHYANEEAVFVLEGSGTLRLDGKMIPIKQWDYIAFPAGKSYAHQIINTSDASLIIFCFSTMNHPDIVEYPDSNKIGVTAGVAPGGEDNKLLLKARYCKQDEVDYYDGES